MGKANMTKKRTILMTDTKIPINIQFSDFVVDEMEKEIEVFQPDDRGGWTKESVKVRGKLDSSYKPDVDWSQYIDNRLFEFKEEVIKETKKRVLQELKKERGEMDIIDMTRTISDKEAENEIRNILERFGSEGKTSINLLDIIVETNLSSEQIEKVMGKLQEEGVKEIA